MNFLCKIDTSINWDLNGKKCAQPNGLICFSQTVSQSVECMDFITLEWSQIKSSIASRCNENKNNLLCVNEWDLRADLRFLWTAAGQLISLCLIKSCNNLHSIEPGSSLLKYYIYLFLVWCLVWWREKQKKIRAWVPCTTLLRC